MLPAFATMAELAISLAKRIMTVPFADGFIIPVIRAMLPLKLDEAFDAAGIA